MDRRFGKRIVAYLDKHYAQAIEHTNSRDIFGWFDLWHTHIDWKSKCNRFPETRAIVARMTYELLLATERHFAPRFTPRREPIQIFALISEDTGSNAVYVHTPNPNGTPYPCELSNVDWDVEAPVEFAEFVDQSIHEIGTGQSSHFIRRREPRSIT